VILAFNFHWNGEICLVEDLITAESARPRKGSLSKAQNLEPHLETAVDKSLIQIQYKALSILEMWLDRRKQILFVGLGLRNGRRGRRWLGLTMEMRPIVLGILKVSVFGRCSTSSSCINGWRTCFYCWRRIDGHPGILWRSWLICGSVDREIM
jgi:hypothetical protein